MTKRFFAIITVGMLMFAALAVPNKAEAQARGAQRNQVLSMDLLGLFQTGSMINLQYEWKTAATNSWFVRGLFSSYTSAWLGFGVGAGYRFFIADSRALTALSVAPVLHAFFYNSSDLGRTSTVFTVGGELAYKWIFDQFSVEPSLGVGIGFGGGDITYLTTTRAYFQIHLGYAW